MILPGTMSAPVQEDGVQRFVKKKKNSSKYDFVKVRTPYIDRLLWASLPMDSLTLMAS